MENIRILATKATAKIEIPVKELMLNSSFNGKDIYEVQNIFSDMLNAEMNFDIKSDYELCCRTLKWAYTCNAKLKSIVNVIGDSKAVIFELSFSDVNDLTEFTDNLSVNVN